jgi:hypothetical protein
MITMPDTPTLLDPPGTPTLLGLTAEEYHALWYGILDAFGRFHEAELPPDELAALKERKHYFWAGQFIGIGFRSSAGAAIVYLTTGNLNGALISMLLLVAGDQYLGTRTGKTDGVKPT